MRGATNRRHRLMTQTVRKNTAIRLSSSNDCLCARKSWSCAKSSCSPGPAPTTLGASSPTDHMSCAKTTKPTLNTKLNSAALSLYKAIATMETDAISFIKKKRNLIRPTPPSYYLKSKTSESTSCPISKKMLHLQD